MKKLILISLTVLSINANAQYNLKWSLTQSLSAGLYPSYPVMFQGGNSGEEIYVVSNDVLSWAYDSVIQGVVSKYDIDGNLEWLIPLDPPVIADNFPAAGVTGSDPSDEPTEDIVVAYNTDPTTSHLIKINSNGNIAFDHVLSGICQVSSISDDTSGWYIVGRTLQTTCGAFQCNGVAVAKYDLNGQLQWKKTKYSSGFKTRPASMATDPFGNIFVTGQRAANSVNGGIYTNSFVLKYSPQGSLLFEKVFNELSTEIADQLCQHDSTEYTFASETIDTATSIVSIKLRRLNPTNGKVQWTKTINNAELIGIMIDDPVWSIATSTGMRAYNSAGTLIWSNDIISVQESNLGCWICDWTDIARNVDANEPLSNFLIQLDVATGTVLNKKKLSPGNHEEYLGDYAGMFTIGQPFDSYIYLFINDTTPPYGTRLTRLDPCADFTYSFTASTSVTNVSNTTCSNGEITVNTAGTFNSWAHVELWKGTGIIESQDYSDMITSHTFQNLSPGTYTVKAFDESCGEQDFDVTVKCAKPSSGLTTTNIMSTSAKANWNATTCNNKYRIQYRKTGTMAWTTISNINNPFYTMTGLMPNTSHEWHVSTKCNSSGTAVYSAYSAIQTFTTSQFRLNEEEGYGSNEEQIKLSIYPNPVSSSTTIEITLDHVSVVSLALFDAAGRKVANVFEGELPEGVQQAEWNKENLASGIYFMTLVAGKEVQRTKVVVE